MLQQVMTNPGEIIFREVPVPEVKDDQVLVKIMNIGICGSDIHVYHGKHHQRHEYLHAVSKHTGYLSDTDGRALIGYDELGTDNKYKHHVEIQAELHKR